MNPFELSCHGGDAGILSLIPSASFQLLSAYLPSFPPHEGIAMQTTPSRPILLTRTHIIPTRRFAIDVPKESLVSADDKQIL
jgi:hypothetical protein